MTCVSSQPSQPSCEASSSVEFEDKLDSPVQERFRERIEGLQPPFLLYNDKEFVTLNNNIERLHYLQRKEEQLPVNSHLIKTRIRRLNFQTREKISRTNSFVDIKVR